MIYYFRKLKEIIQEIEELAEYFWKTSDSLILRTVRINDNKNTVTMWMEALWFFIYNGLHFQIIQSEISSFQIWASLCAGIRVSYSKIHDLGPRAYVMFVTLLQRIKLFIISSSSVAVCMLGTWESRKHSYVWLVYIKWLRWGVKNKVARYQATDKCTSIIR